MTSAKETTGELEFRVVRARCVFDDKKFSTRLFLLDIRHRTQLQFDVVARDFRSSVSTKVWPAFCENPATNRLIFGENDDIARISRGIGKLLFKYV